MKAIDLCQKKLKKEAEDMTESGLFIFLVILVLFVVVVAMSPLIERRISVRPVIR